MDAVSITLQFFFNRQRTVLMGLTLSCRARSGLTLSLLPVKLDAIVKESIMRAPLSAPRRLAFGPFEADHRRTMSPTVEDAQGLLSRQPLRQSVEDCV
jgi:hypothetical protein